ncbi:hypothetical protein AWM68_17815 [Fictibacillus phosphorivorans]|uniref:ParM/StbA family protein n=1 Tax=Fictibacillus phosphorivorans TaxID=1221500 RepID=A0A163S2Y2_9BACL|nr:ParM/StbA family protein [Fictibacillus phosphorivorans]KZE68027.1 hypothetical protein AWM68_17815 [Fictibacillus phosphorivorans]
MYLKVGNDNGNSEQAIIINGDLYRQPNVNAFVQSVPSSDDTTVEALIPNIMNNLVVSIESPSTRIRSGTYYVGKFALESGKTLSKFTVGIDKKHNSDLPIINTLGNIAGYAVLKSFEKNNTIPTELKVKVDMTTALPINDWNPEASKIFIDRFKKGNHRVSVHVGNISIPVTVTFEDVYVMPEGTPAVFAMQKNFKVAENAWRKDKIFDDFNKLYDEKIDGSYFSDLKVAHVDIGDGTTDFAITEGLRFLPTFKLGKNVGVGHAITEAIPLFEDATNLSNIERQEYSKYLKDKKHKYYSDAQRFFFEGKVNQSSEIVSYLQQQLNKIRNEVDLILVYGGGSIAMRDALEERIATVAEDARTKLFYVPSDYAVTLNAEGMYLFVTSKIFDKYKKQQKEKVTN